MDRWLPDRPLPRYAYVPGHYPRPSAAAELGATIAGEPGVGLRPDAWQACEGYLWGLDLFNLGFYWEAHEAWEALWRVASRHGPVALFLKGLIKLAAAAVKIRLGQRAAARSLARNAVRHFETVHEREGPAGLAGLALADLLQLAQAVEDAPLGDPALTVQRVVAGTLRASAEVRGSQ